MKRLIYETGRTPTSIVSFAARLPIGDGRRGICGVRENRGGVSIAGLRQRDRRKYRSHRKKNPSSMSIPGSKSYSIATVGCNFPLHLLP